MNDPAAPLSHTLEARAHSAMDSGGSARPAKRRKKKPELVVGPIWLDVKQLRVNRGERQEQFWRRFGVAQWTGSRYETDGRHMPRAVQMLVIAFASGMVTDDDLDRLLAAAEAAAGD
jgi:hypothetical protein